MQWERPQDKVIYEKYGHSPREICLTRYLMHSVHHDMKANPQ